MRNSILQAVLSTVWKTSLWIPFFCFLVSGLPCRAQELSIRCHEFPPECTDTPDTLYYGFQCPLRWSDFRGTPQRESSSAAITFAGFSMDARSRMVHDSLRIDVYLQTYFDKQGSWFKPGQVDAYALSHEQLHFDLAKLWELRFRKFLDTLRTDSVSYSSDIQLAYLDYYRHFTRQEMAFDRQTDHGLLPTEEHRWEQEIHEALRKLYLQDGQAP